jgi:hypothetical protein
MSSAETRRVLSSTDLSPLTFVHTWRRSPHAQYTAIRRRDSSAKRSHRQRRNGNRDGIGPRTRLRSPRPPQGTGRVASPGGPMSTSCPASILRGHPNTRLLLDRNSARRQASRASPGSHSVCSISPWRRPTCWPGRPPSCSCSRVSHGIRRRTHFRRRPPRHVGRHGDSWPCRAPVWDGGGIGHHRPEAGAIPPLGPGPALGDLLPALGLRLRIRQSMNVVTLVEIRPAACVSWLIVA